MCGMYVTCDSCHTDISYRDNVVQQVVIHGMRDNDVRIRVLSRNTAGELNTLDRLIAYIAAEEAGISESFNINQNAVGGVRRSSYRAQQNAPSRPPGRKCNGCGEKWHDDRTKQCKAWGKQCTKCQRLHHFAKV